MNDPRDGGINPGFEAAYHGPPPPWDIGRPQPAFLALARDGELDGRVLDVGCGTGEHALMAAALGHPATGIDAAPTAISLARRKAAQRGLVVRFVVGDALDLALLRETFETVLDCGLLHGFSDADQRRFVEGLRGAIVPGGRYHVLTFSDREPGVHGPRRLREAQIRAAFATGWRVDRLERSLIETTEPHDPVQAWLGSFTRL
jgi:SAM-dependent methyltransferase